MNSAALASRGFASPCHDSSSGHTAQPPERNAYSKVILVPELIQACMLAVQSMHIQKGGSFLQRLRLVSLDAKQAAEKEVHGYTLELGKPLHPKLAAFLNRSGLCHLRLTIPTLFQGTTVAKTMSTHLQTVVTSAGPALRRVSHLTLILPETIPALVTNMLTVLVDACPGLERLTMNDSVESSFLQHVGLKCPKLTCFEANLIQLPVTTVHLLTTHLPHLRTLRETSHIPIHYTAPQMSEHMRWKGWMPLEEAFFYTLRAAPKLLHLDLGLMHLTTNIWNALPDELSSLCCLCSSQGPYSLKYYLSKKFAPYPGTSKYSAPKGHWAKHTGLKSIVLTGNCMGEAVALVEGLLLVSPNVRSLHLRDTDVIDLALSHDCGRYLQSLDRRMDQRLDRPIDQGMGRFARKKHQQVLITGQQPSSSPLKTGPCKLHLLFRIAPRDASKQEQVMSGFMAAMMGKPLLNFGKVILYNGGRAFQQRADFTLFSVLFPKIVILCVENMSLTLPDVCSLAGCASLQRLELRNVQGFAENELAQLCARPGSLKCVTLHGCRGFVRSTGANMVEIRKSANRNVSVSINHEFLWESE